MNVTSKISVDLTRPNMGTWVNAMQGDGNTRIVEVSLLSGGKAWEPPADAEAAIAYYQLGGVKGLYNLLADGTAAISISGNVATIVLAPQMLTASGTVQASLVFNDQQLNRLTTFPFSVFVESNPAAGAQKVEDYIRLQWLEGKLDEYLRKAADSGEFDGAPGPQGPQGEHGPQGIPGTDGRDGVDGKDGAPGHTPVYGVDYGTPEQITGIAKQAAEILQPEVDQIKDDLANKLPKSPADWEPWTAEEQAAAREMINAGSSWGMDLPLLKIITLDEAVSSIDILSKEEGITLQEFSVFLFATAAGDDGVAFSGQMCLRSNGGAQYWGYSHGFIKKIQNAYKIWHTKIYDNKFALTDTVSGSSNISNEVAFDGFQGLYDATQTQYSAVTSISGIIIKDLNLFLSADPTSGAVIPRGSMIYLFGR